MPLTPTLPLPLSPSFSPTTTHSIPFTSSHSIFSSFSRCDSMRSRDCMCMHKCCVCVYSTVRQDGNICGPPSCLCYVAHKHVGLYLWFYLVKYQGKKNPALFSLHATLHCSYRFSAVCWIFHIVLIFFNAGAHRFLQFTDCDIYTDKLKTPVWKKDICASSIKNSV